MCVQDVGKLTPRTQNGGAPSTTSATGARTQGGMDTSLGTDVGWTRWSTLTCRT